MPGELRRMVASSAAGIRKVISPSLARVHGGVQRQRA